jgi:hypothetical protein
MIGDLNDTLKHLLLDRIPLDPREVEIAFDPPNHDWTSAVSKPTINCYLYHVQENRQLRNAEWEHQRTNGRGEAVRKRLPYRIELHYLITVWATAIEDEHRLLWRILAVLMRYQELPPESLKGTLSGGEWPIPIQVAQPEGMLKNPSDFWSTFENFMKPAVNCAVTVPLDPELETRIPLVLTRRLRVTPTLAPDNGAATALDYSYSVGGFVLARAEDAAGLPGLSVQLVERGMTQPTDAAGRFQFDRLAPGRYTLEATQGDRTVRQVVTVPGANYDLVFGSPTGAEASPPPQKGGTA